MGSDRGYFSQQRKKTQKSDLNQVSNDKLLIYLDKFFIYNQTSANTTIYQKNYQTKQNQRTPKLCLIQMNNQMHGLCSKCIQKVDSPQPQAISYKCYKCQQNEAQFIVNDNVICLHCYMKSKDSQSVMKKSQSKNLSLLTLVSKGDLGSGSFAGSFLGRNGKVIKKLEKILTTYELKSNAIIQELTKKSTLCGSATQLVQWQKIADKCHKAAGVIYIFIGKQAIFGSFHTQPVKISSSSESSFVQDTESGLFTTERVKYDLSIYKVSKSVVKYSAKTKSVGFGDPAAFEICFTGKEILIKSQFEEQLKWEHFFVYKL